MARDSGVPPCPSRPSLSPSDRRRTWTRSDGAALHDERLGVEEERRGHGWFEAADRWERVIGSIGWFFALEASPSHKRPDYDS